MKAGERLNTAVGARGTLSTNALKIWAIAAMVCDHIPWMTESLQAQYYMYPWFLMHAAGRLTAPIFFYLLALGYRRTNDANRYTVRLLVFALISYVPYIRYFKGGTVNAQNFMELNVIFTMLFGLLLLRSLHEIKKAPLKALCIALCLLGGYWCDYGLYGIAVIVICGLAAGSRRATMIGMGAVMMVYVSTRLGRLFPSDAGPFEHIEIISASPQVQGMIVVLLAQLVPLILIARHRAWSTGALSEPKPVFLAKWGFYIFYPAHIIALLFFRGAGFFA